MQNQSARLAFAFSSLGHFYIHMFQAYYAIVVLTLEKTWNQPYEDLLRLWVVGAIMIGLGAVPAGRLADLWGARIMMLVYFIGLGGTAIACGLVGGPTAMMVGLAMLGLFLSIYHPVGIPWLIRNAESGVGKQLAVNGLFGSFGTAAAGIVAGNLVAWFGWRMAYVIPGIVCLLTGLAMLFFVVTGRISATDSNVRQEKPRARGDVIRVMLILIAAVFVGGIVYNTLQTALPKVFQQRLSDMFGDGPQAAGNLFALVFALGGVIQLVGGHLADRFPLKLVYLACWVGQTVMMLAIAFAFDLSVVAFAALSVMINVAGIPAEAMMLYRFTPEKHRGLVFGVKFVLSFLAGPVAIMLISLTREATGEFVWLFAGIAVATGLVALLLLALPAAEAPRSSEMPAE